MGLSPRRLAEDHERVTIVRDYAAVGLLFLTVSPSDRNGHNPNVARVDVPSIGSLSHREASLFLVALFGYSASATTCGHEME